MMWRLAGLMVLLVGGLWFGPAVAGTPGRECHTLSCVKCQKVCAATCEADSVRCDAKHLRGCQAAYRSCEKGCRSELCAQCVPIQYDGSNRKFLPGKTELCRTPGHGE